MSVYIESKEDGQNCIRVIPKESATLYKGKMMKTIDNSNLQPKMSVRTRTNNVLFSNSWGETLKLQKSALRWDIKRAMTGLCKKLSELGEECFVATVNTTNGFVGHTGTLRGEEFINTRSSLLYEFLDYCCESDESVKKHADIQSNSEESDVDMMEDRNQSRTATQNRVIHTPMENKSTDGNDDDKIWISNSLTKTANPDGDGDNAVARGDPLLNMMPFANVGEEETIRLSGMTRDRGEDGDSDDDYEEEDNDVNDTRTTEKELKDDATYQPPCKIKIQSPLQTSLRRKRKSTTDIHLNNVQRHVIENMFERAVLDDGSTRTGPAQDETADSPGRGKEEDGAKTSTSQESINAFTQTGIKTSERKSSTEVLLKRGLIPGKIKVTIEGSKLQADMAKVEQILKAIDEVSKVKETSKLKDTSKVGASNEPRIPICKVCLTQFADKDLLRKHLVDAKHMLMIKTDKICGKCGLANLTQNLLRQHMKVCKGN